MCGFSSDRNERDSESRHLFDLLYGFIFTVDYHQLSFTICECVLTPSMCIGLAVSLLCCVLASLVN